MKMKKLLLCVTGTLLTLSTLGNLAFAGKIPVAVDSKNQSENRHSINSSSASHKVVGRQNMLGKKLTRSINTRNSNNINNTSRPNNFSSNIIDSISEECENNNSNIEPTVNGNNNVDAGFATNADNNVNTEPVINIDNNVNTEPVININNNVNTNSQLNMDPVVHLNNNVNEEPDVNISLPDVTSTNTINCANSGQTLDVKNAVNCAAAVRTNLAEERFNENKMDQGTNSNKDEEDFVIIEKPFKQGYFKVPRSMEARVRQHINVYLGLFNDFIKDNRWMRSGGFTINQGLFSISPRFFEVNGVFKIGNVANVKVPILNKDINGYKVEGFKDITLDKVMRSEEGAKMIIFSTFLPEEICLLDEISFSRQLSMTQVEAICNHFYKN